MRGQGGMWGVGSGKGWDRPKVRVLRQWQPPDRSWVMTSLPDLTAKLILPVPRELSCTAAQANKGPAHGGVEFAESVNQRFGLTSG